MQDEIIVENVKFWLDQNIIHCKFNSKFDKRYLEKEIKSLFFEAISMLSNGIYRPILIDLSKLSVLKAIYFFKFLSRDKKIKSLVLSKSFLVSSLEVKIFLELYNMGGDCVVPNRVSTNYNAVVKFSNTIYNQFNASY